MDRYFNRTKGYMSHVYGKANQLISKGTDKLVSSASGQIPRIYRKVVGTRPGMITPERSAWLQSYRQSDIIGEHYTLYGPSNMAYFEIPSLEKKIIIFGEVHTERDLDEKNTEILYTYGMKEFLHKVFSSGQRKNQCIDFFLEDSFTPGEKGKIFNRNYKTMLEGPEPSNSMAYLRHLFRDCLELKENMCKFSDIKYQNVRFQRWDLRQIYPKTMNEGSCADIFYTIVFIVEILNNTDKKICRKYVNTVLSFIYGISTEPSSIEILVKQTNGLYIKFFGTIATYFKKIISSDFSIKDLTPRYKDLLLDCLKTIRQVITKQIDKCVKYLNVNGYKTLQKEHLHKFFMVHFEKSILSNPGQGYLALAFTDVYLFCRMFRKFVSSNNVCNTDISRIILYGGNLHTNNIINMIKIFFINRKWGHLVYQSEIKKDSDLRNKFVRMLISKQNETQKVDYNPSNLKGFDDLIERFLS